MPAAPTIVSLSFVKNAITLFIRSLIMILARKDSKKKRIDQRKMQIKMLFIQKRHTIANSV
jgi:hypothetical protein